MWVLQFVGRKNAILVQYLEWMVSDLIFKICQISSHGENLKHDISFPIFNFGSLLSRNISRSYFG